jgi:exopolyphosphatase/guanosine-5'-triphosphate,3'-diphosphate pyrophosphatase
VRFAADQVLSDPAGGLTVVPREPFVAFCDQISGYDAEQLVEQYHLPQADAETLVPALLAYRELVLESAASEITLPEASLRGGLLLDLSRSEDRQTIQDFSRQVLASAEALGEKYRYDAPHGKKVAQLTLRLFDDLRVEHGLGERDRVLLEVAALLHDIGNYVALRGHHKHSWYLLSVSEIFGLTQDDMAVVANVARYHRRALPQKSHLPYMALDREARVRVNKLAAILRLANALDADHLQKIQDVRLVPEDGEWILEVEGAGDLTMERLAAQARSDLITEVFGRRLAFREARPRAWA